LEDWGGGRKPWIVKSEDDTFPLDFGFLGVDQEAERSAGGSQIVDALCGVFVGEMVDAFEFDHKHIFDEKVGEVFPNAKAFVVYFERCFGLCAEAAEGEFPEQGARIDFLQESGAEGVRNFEDGVEYAL